MNNGVTNEAIRCFRRLFDGVRRPGAGGQPQAVQSTWSTSSPGTSASCPSHQVDLVLSSGGPGSPHDGWEQRWCTGYRHFLDWMMDAAVHRPDAPPAGFLVCHSYEIAVQHFALRPDGHRGEPQVRDLPGLRHGGRAGRPPFLAPFDDRLFIWEHRHWQAVEMDAAQGGPAWAERCWQARAARAGTTRARRCWPSGFGPGLDGTQFHPEADRAGVLAWIDRPEHASALRDAYGHSLYDRMMRTLADPTRLARTFALLLPGWLTERFNRLAAVRGLHPIPPPVQSMEEFEERALAS